MRSVVSRHWHNRRVVVIVQGRQWNCLSRRVNQRIASPEMFPEAEMLPHLICSRPILIGGANDEADQHGGA